jgi:nucleoside-diphosphate-sugar epimerase
MDWSGPISGIWRTWIRCVAEYSRLRVLVTGASGFVGAALAARLTSRQIEVRGTHRRAVPPSIAGVEWRHVSQLDQPASLATLLEGCDTVVHLAALAHQAGRAAWGRSAEFTRVNVESTRLLAVAARAANVRRFVFASSVAAICSQSDEWVDERTSPRPDSDYGRSKLAAEQALEAQLRGSDTDWCAVRPPLVYGPGNPGNMARLQRLIELGLPLPLGSIRNRRSFIFIDNLVDALATIVGHPKSIRSVYMLSDGSDFTTPELILQLAAAAGRRVRLVRVPVTWLKGAGRAGDALSRLFGVGTGIDSYSVERLVGSLPVNGTLFRTSFGWEAPTDASRAIAVTGAAPRTRGT